MRIYNTELFYPMLAMFLWTVVVMLRNLQVRVAAVGKGDLPADHFELLKKPSHPKPLNRRRIISDITEMPPLFYIICLALMLMGLH